MNSSLSCHSTKATLYKIDRLEKDDNIVIKILFANGKIAEVIFSTLLRLEIHIQFEIFKNFAGRIIVALRLAKDCLALS